MPGERFSKEEVEAWCPVGKDCWNRQACTLADIHEHCSLYKDALIKIMKDLKQQDED